MSTLLLSLPPLPSSLLTPLSLLFLFFPFPSLLPNKQFHHMPIRLLCWSPTAKQHGAFQTWLCQLSNRTCGSPLWPPCGTVWQNLAMQGFNRLWGRRSRKLAGSSCVGGTERRQNGSRACKLFSNQLLPTVFDTEVFFMAVAVTKMVSWHENWPQPSVLCPWSNDRLQSCWLLLNSVWVTFELLMSVAGIVPSQQTSLLKCLMDAHSYHRHHQIKLDRSVLKVRRDAVI